MKKILVTGATGFIGKHVIERLLQEKVEVIATSAHPAKAEVESWFHRVRYIPFDLTSFHPATDYFRFFGEPDALIHLAWEGLPNYKADFHLDVNLPRHKAFLNSLVGTGLRDITVTGSCLEYGLHEGCLLEDTPAKPIHAYGKAKEALRSYLEEIAVSHCIPVKWARLFYMYGKGQSPNSLLSQLDRALAAGDQVFNMSGGEQLRDYLPVEQVVDYIVKVALQKAVDGVIHVCSGQPITVRELVENHLRKAGKTIQLKLGFYPYPDYEPMRFWGDTTKLRSILQKI